MTRSAFAKSARQRGAALILVLSMMALMAVVCVAFLVSSSKQVSISNQSASIIQGTEAAEIALNQILQDFRQEIRAGSLLPDPKRVVPSLTANVLYPAAPQSAVPDRTSAQATGVPAGSTPPNLVKQSRSEGKFYNDELTAVYPRAASFPVGLRASALNSSDPSLSSSVSESKWNKPLLLPRSKPDSLTDLTPKATGTASLSGNEDVPWKWKAPDWIFLQKDGQTNSGIAGKMSEALVSGANPVMARYAYQVYDEGGLLDLNVAGYDPKMTSPANAPADVLASRRGSLGFADLREVGLTDAMLKKLIELRNPATLKEADVAPYNNRYANFLLNGRVNLGFMRVAGSADAGVALSNRALPSRLALIDFTQKLAANDTEKAELLNSLEYLTHYTRGLEQPSYRPGYYDASSDPEMASFKTPTIVPPEGSVDDRIYPIASASMPGINGVESVVLKESLIATEGGALYNNPGDPGGKSVVLKLHLPFVASIGNNRGGNDQWGKVSLREPSKNDLRNYQDIVNPGFLEVRIQPDVPSDRRRIDKTAFIAGEPLVKKRFPLDRLAWLTPRGPSAKLPKSDALYNEVGTEDAIFDSFGLSWESAGSFWVYDHGKKHHGYMTGDHGKPGGIYRLEDIAANDTVKGFPREPDLFELLKASIAAGSLGKSAVSRVNDINDGATPIEPTHYNHARDRKLDYQVFDIGVNMVDQYDTDSFPTIVKLPVPEANLAKAPATALPLSPPLYVARGVENLPYIYRFHWRGITDNTKPASPLPMPAAPMEITNTLSAYNSFSPGLISVVGFPELWNPYAAPLTTSNEKPSEFRAVAVSEAPEALVDPLLYFLPRALPAGNNTASEFYKAGRPEFTIRPIGNFVYSGQWGNLAGNPESGFSLSWMGYVDSSDYWGGWNTGAGRLGGSNMRWNNRNFCFEWALAFPSDRVSLGANVAGNTPPLFNSNLSTMGSLFFNRAPSASMDNYLTGASGGTPPPTTARVPQFFISLLPITGINTGVGSLLSVTPAPPTPLPPGSTHPDITYADYGGLPMQPLPPPSNWGQVGVISGNGWALASRFDIVQNASSLCVPDNMYGLPWPSSSGYRVPPYPYCPNPENILTAGNFSIDHINKGFTDPSRARPYQQHLFVLTDSTVARDVVHSDSSSNTAPGQSASGVMSVPYPRGDLGGTMGSDRILDKRGTELRFTVSNTQVFREPSTLCQPGVPAGSNLSLGSGNFFSANGGGPSYGGQQWIGFSLGELPAQTIVLSKTYMISKGNQPKDSENLVRGYYVKENFDDIPFDVLTVNSNGQTGAVVRGSSAEGASLNPPQNWGRGWDSAGGGTVLTGPTLGYYPGMTGYGGQLPGKVVTNATLYAQDGGAGTVPIGTVNNLFPQAGIFPNPAYPAGTSGSNTVFSTLGGGGTWPPAAGYRVRYFLVPTNLAGIKKTHLTVRLQYKDSRQNWVTYDERYMRVTDWAGGRGSSSPVMGSQEVLITGSPVPLTGSTGIPLSTEPQNGSTIPGQAASTNNLIPWGHPVVTSFDPRTPRFGSPFRTGYNAFSPMRGSKANGRQLLASTVSNPSGLGIGDLGTTDRPTSALFDDNVVGNPQTLVANFDTPGSFWQWFHQWGTMDLPTTYLNTVGNVVTATEDQGKKSVLAPTPGGVNSAGKNFTQNPTLNANDFGWFPRYAGQGGPVLVTPSTVGTGTSIRKKSQGLNLPNFFQSAVSPVGADWSSATAGLRADGSYGNASAPIADTLRLGAFTENVAPTLANPYAQAYADPDDVIRRASGAFAGGATGKAYTGIDGLPEAQKGGSTPTQAGTRPVILDRPFRSVAELGYVFRGAPWKNLSFFTPETGDAALLDVFCLTEPPPIATEDTTDALPSAAPLVAGKLNLNTRQEPVLRALLSGALKDELGATAGAASGAAFSSDAAGVAARAVINRTTGNETYNGPLTNVSELAGKLLGKDLKGFTSTDPVYTSTTYKTPSPSFTGTEVRNKDMTTGASELNWHFSGLSADLNSMVFTDPKDWKNQRRREAVLRALADVGQTRVWNLLIDLIVQTGRFPVGSNDLTRFAKEGETRVWLHVSIDRFTGEILDKQLEWVPE